MIGSIELSATDLLSVPSWLRDCRTSSPRKGLQDPLPMLTTTYAISPVSSARKGTVSGAAARPGEGALFIS